MTMFDTRLHKTISSFGECWGSDEHKFRNHMHLGTGPDDTVVLNVKANSQIAPILSMTRSEYESWLRHPIRAARCGDTYGQRFFSWHLLGERNLQQTFLTKLKELQNA